MNLFRGNYCSLGSMRHFPPSTYCNPHGSGGAKFERNLCAGGEVKSEGEGA